MRVLIAGSDEVWSVERYFRKYLAAEGVEVETVALQSAFYRYYNKGLVNKLLFKAGLSGIPSWLDGMLRTAVERFRPDVLWVFKGMEITPAALQWVREQGVKLVNYNPDNPFVFTGKGSGNRNVTDSIGLYDLHFSYDRTIQERIIREYKLPCLLLPFGFELRDELYTECTRQDETVRTCFMGNPDPDRVAFLLQLADRFPIDVYGSHWERSVKHPNVTLCSAVYGDDFWRTLRRYRVQLNLMRVHNPASHNMRSFEIPGVGGIGLFPRTIDHTLFFEEEKEVFLFDEVGECKEKMHTILNLTSAQAGGIRLAARHKSLAGGYTYRDRAIQALRGMEGLF